MKKKLLVFESFLFANKLINTIGSADNFIHWTEKTHKTYNEFLTQIKLAIDGIEALENKDILTIESLDDYLAKIEAFEDPYLRRKAIDLILKHYKTGSKSKSYIKVVPKVTEELEIGSILVSKQGGINNVFYYFYYVVDMGKNSVKLFSLKTDFIGGEKSEGYCVPGQPIISERPTTHRYREFNGKIFVTVVGGAATLWDGIERYYILGK